MSVNAEVMNKVSELLKNQEAVDKMNECSTKEDVFAIATQHISGVSMDEFFEAVDEFKAANGISELSDEELEGVAGGKKVLILHIEKLRPVEE